MSARHDGSIRRSEGWLAPSQRAIVPATVTQVSETFLWVHSTILGCQNRGGQKTSVRFEIDDTEQCKSLLGREVLCLNVCSRPPYPGVGVGLLLVPAQPQQSKDLPLAVRNSPIFRRIGISDLYRWDNLGHSVISEELILTLV